MNQKNTIENPNRRRFLKILGTLAVTTAAGKNKEALALGKEVVDEIEKEGKQPQETEFNIEEIRRITEIVRSRSGAPFAELKSRGVDGEFYPSTINALFEKDLNESTNEVTGGFDQDLQIMSRYGTCVEIVPMSLISVLFERHAEQLPSDRKVLEAVLDVAQDKLVFEVLKSFLAESGYFKYGRGRYRSKPLNIEFGAGVTGKSKSETLYHELLHYVFDKVDSNLSDKDGNDHAPIASLDDRFTILSSIRKGEIPIKEKIMALYGYTNYGEIGRKINDLLLSGNSKEMMNFMESDDFYTGYVHSSMFRILSREDTIEKWRDFRTQLSDGRTLRVREDYGGSSEGIKEIDYGGSDGIFLEIRVGNIEDFDVNRLMEHIPEQDWNEVLAFLKEHRVDPNKSRESGLTDDQIHDVVYLNGYNATILQQSFRLAIAMSDKSNTSVQDTFKQKEYQQAFSNFLKDFSEQQAINQRSPVKKTAFKVMDQIIKIAI